MKKLTQRTVAVGLLSAGLVLAAGGPAFADRSAKHAKGGGDLTSIGNVGILNGNQIYMPIQIPINVCGNAIGILGNAAASCEGGASAVIW
jgi:hypothetical protein